MMLGQTKRYRGGLLRLDLNNGVIVANDTTDRASSPQDSLGEALQMTQNISSTLRDIRELLNDIDAEESERAFQSAGRD